MIAYFLFTEIHIEHIASCAPLLAVVTQSLVFDRKWMIFSKIIQFLVGCQLQNLQSRIRWKKSVKFLASLVQFRGKNIKQSIHIRNKNAVIRVLKDKHCHNVKMVCKESILCINCKVEVVGGAIGAKNALVMEAGRPPVRATPLFGEPQCTSTHMESSRDH